MDPQTLRLLVRHKLQDGRLPRSRIGTISTGPGGGNTCDGCEARIRELANDEFERGLAAGRQLELDEAVEEALVRSVD